MYNIFLFKSKFHLFFRVKRVKGLRVMDASILPYPVSTFPNDILIRLAEYAAQLITKHKQ